MVHPIDKPLMKESVEPRINRDSLDVTVAGSLYWRPAPSVFMAFFGAMPFCPRIKAP